MIDNKIFEKFTIHAKSSLNESLNIANYYGSDSICPEHLMFAIFLEKGSLGSNILTDLHIKKESFDKIFKFKNKNKKIIKNLELSPELKKNITRAYLLASNFNYSYIGTEHLVFSIIEAPNPMVTKILDINAKNSSSPDTSSKKPSDKILNPHLKGKNILDKSFLSGIFKALNIPEADFPAFSNNSTKNNTTPNLDYFCNNLNTKVKNEETLLIGREEEMERIFNSLGRKSKNNPLLIGDPGIGKTALIEGLAQRINSERVPQNLLNKKILALDIALVVAGTNFRGEFEQRLKDILQEAAANKDTLLFIDEIHGIVGAGNASGGLDAANILKPLLTQGTIRCIGATTIEEYKKYIEKDSALERRFQPIMLKEPSAKDSLKIIKGIRKNYEKFHNVDISDGALAAAVDLSSRYIQDRFQPDKSIDLIDETSSRIKNKHNVSPATKELRMAEKKLDSLIEQKNLLIAEEKYDEAITLRKKEELLLEKISQLKNKQQKFEKDNKLVIEPEDIAQTISLGTNIPVQKILAQSSDRSKNIFDKLNHVVIGQPEALKKISQAILRAQSGIGDTEKPIGSFLFLGPSGVGKTLCAKTLAQEFFGDTPSSLIKIDMSEFIEKHNVSRLIGAPAGYIGYGEGGKLTEKVRRQPYSLILFDEIEKAHPDVFNILLQLLEEGILTDAEGRKVNFKNTIIILTSNIGTKEFTRATSIGFSSRENKNQMEKKFAHIKRKVLAELKEKIKPEILNRLDEIIVFDALNKKDIEEIVALELKKLSQRLHTEKKIKLTYSKNLVKFIIDKSFSTEKGARYIKKNIRDFVENEIADKITYAKIKNNALKLDVKDKKISSH
ncbi:MAG: ATPase AAA-2 domain protein [Candidatus Moranbacteria bacterium GW2011_GWE1_35_17]|nr:MAG: ATPase AAA-2 domain protein [Candidatus Moranbacteria bacterium GW2011_GWE1_35_17]KKP69288.1 MAG: ATPase AAA-2 domain protein [Candidatus Moranbacteria bacterium GW2011_GWE2_35_164]KKP82071.1 MAG: ATPase AAA-2 domain protein [Candidatus Moranbacteria bacterium GW2011_GWF1_35_5]KKP84383.1 MAG: ATPase AAA-2 domain protein [Candidatus Moranbacteria bacterium GW2011_GWF2_35_54]